MHTSWKFAAVAILLALGVSLGYGWGNATHVWFANKLGVESGVLNQNEMYGAVLPDLFGYEFTNARAMAADYGLHVSGDLFFALYGSASTPEAKACFYGMFTHSNAPGIMGADWYAHGVYPVPGQGMPDPAGWVISQGDILVRHPLISAYIAQLVGDFSPYFLPVVGHTLIETAVDILIKRNEDPLVGGLLYTAAESRSFEVPVVLAKVIAKADNGFPHADYTLTRESAYRIEMMQYGQLFTLKEPEVVDVLSQQTAVLAQAYLQVAGVTPSEPIDPARIARFIRIAIEQVEPIYREELMYTLASVKTNLQGIGAAIAYQGNASSQREPARAQSATPTEISLDQNYPNPFNPTTTIAFALPGDQIVTLRIYNAIGQEVATLMDEFKTAGRYSALWDAKGVPSGVYFCRLQAGNVIEMKKMTLLK